MILIALNQNLKIYTLEQIFHSNPIRLFYIYDYFSEQTKIGISLEISYNKNY